MNNLKTVRDAVIYFKGEWGGTDEQQYIYKSCCDKSFGYGARRTEMTIGTHHEFNDCVDFLASNMGRSSQSYADYKAIQKAVDAVSRAASCFCKLLLPNSKSSIKFKALTEEMKSLEFTDETPVSGHQNPKQLTELKKELKENDKMKPVYTQEMNDNGILPSEGMEFLDSGSADPELKRICLLVDGDNAVYKDDALGYIGATIEECEPLTPPIKLIDGECYQFTVDKTVYNGVCRKPSKECEAVFTHSHGCVGSNLCTNIQQLTVKAK